MGAWGGKEAMPKVRKEMKVSMATLTREESV